jgi:uncharacterized protein YjhX (UPF0386 family)
MRILIIIKMKVEVTSDKNFMRSGSCHSDMTLKVIEKLRERNSLGRCGRRTINIECCESRFIKFKSDNEYFK